MERGEAIDLLKRYVAKESLLKHCLATGAIMRATALRLGEDTERWEAIGILHDIDFERVGWDMERHGVIGREILLEHGLSEEIAGSVMRHNDLNCGEPSELVDIALQAADNISGLLIACAMVKGGSIGEVSVNMVRKKFRERAFAAGCRRERVEGIAVFIPLPDYFSLAVGALQEIRAEIGLS